MSCRLLEFVSNWVLNKYVRLFVGFVTVIITGFQLVIKLDSIEELKVIMIIKMVYFCYWYASWFIINKSPIEMLTIFIVQTVIDL